MRRGLRRQLAAGAAVALGLGVATVGSGSAQEQARVYVVHGIPSVGEVDVCANGTIELLSDVAFGAVAGITVDAGTYDLTVHAADAGDCTGAELIASPDTDVPAGADVSVVANLTGGAPNLAVYPNNVASIASGSGRVAVYHAADAPTVDILVNNAPGLDDLAQREVASADLPAASYTFTVTDETGNVTVATLEGVEIPAGQLFQVFAVGAFPDESGENPFQVVTNSIDLSITPDGPAPAPAPQPPAPPAAGPAATPRHTG